MKVKDIIGDRSIWMPGFAYDKTPPTVSVLLPTYSRKRDGFFSRAVKSVLSQSINELELIIVDDCSTDGTFDLIKEFMILDGRVSCIRHTQNIGLPAISEFEAYQKSRGRYIAFIFDDNEWEPDGIEQLVNYAEHNQVKAVAGQYKLFNGKPGDSFDDLDKWVILGGKDINLCDLIMHNKFANAATLLNREVVETVGFYDPNIAVSRLWDWDLWQRVMRVFRLEMLDVMIGREFGTGLSDSLGNTHQMYLWGAQERMRQPRNEELLPANYMECDIFEPSLPSSQYLYRSNYWLAEQFLKKPWYDANDISLLAIKQKSEKPWNGKHILYLNASTEVNASSTLNWGRLPYSENYVVYYSSLYYIDLYGPDWLYADAIVIERDLSELVDATLEWAKAAGIPCYYYIDDNFNALASDYANLDMAVHLKGLAALTTVERIGRFEGVFCSTEALREYFIHEKLHDKFLLMEPIVDLEQLQPYHNISDIVNILFFGSHIRGWIIEEIIFPALLNVSGQHHIQFYCPTETFLLLKDKFESITEKKIELLFLDKTNENSKSGYDEYILQINDNFTLYSFPRTLSLDLAMQRLKSKNIQIQLHCGPIIKNNTYKTVNALINAVCLGATLIATNDVPYSKIQSVDPTCLLAENTVEAWEQAIRRMLNASTHKEIYRNALKYCCETFHVKKGVKRLTAALHEIKSCDMIDMNRRLIQHSQRTIPLWLSRISNTAPLPLHVSPTNIVQDAPVTAPMFLSTLSRKQLKRAIRTAIPGWKNTGLKVWKLLPLAISAPITYGQYIESRVFIKSNTIDIVVASDKPLLVMFEFVSDGKLAGQQYVNINTIQLVSLQMPLDRRGLRLRVANCTDGGILYVLQRNIFHFKILDGNSIIANINLQ